ncbi:hypothetical protein GH5_02943 [Leishmania sp. Ghana 2012 LV757]|uniref:hypothetical protein n=1 Tax=Leishmania sp. Ghana 2012 LV757 TaxID=2803181 RepID=UPI001B71544C|nr:hypothetical protein GH5_02943 [Leishmania sp. Ghana 2012 LV757]
MLRRTCLTVLQASNFRLGIAAQKAEPAARKAVAAAVKSPERTTNAGASATGGDTVMDKMVLAAAIGSLVTWWMTVSGPQHQH